ncbi:MAG: hypothetical protein QM645_08955 [Asticcacaulis sp.]
MSGAVALCLCGQVSAQEARGFPDADGPFSAALVVVDDTGMAQFTAPSDEGLRLKAISEVGVNFPVHVKLLFTGMALRDDFGRVEYDIRILTPDGKTYAEHKGLQAFRGATTRADQIFNNSATLTVRFDPTDVSGEYRIHVTAHDLIGDRHVPLHQTLRLVKPDQ